MHDFNITFESEKVLSELSRICLIIALSLNHLHLTGRCLNDVELNEYASLSFDKLYERFVAQAKKISTFSRRDKWEKLFNDFINSACSLLILPTTTPVLAHAVHIDHSKKVTSKLSEHFPRSETILNNCLQLLVHIKSTRFQWRRSLMESIEDINLYITEQKALIKQVSTQVRDSKAPSDQFASSPQNNALTTRLAKANRSRLQNELETQSSRVAASATVNTTAGTTVDTTVDNIRRLTSETFLTEHVIKSHPIATRKAKNEISGDTPLYYWIQSYLKRFPTSTITFEDCFKIGIITHDTPVSSSGESQYTTCSLSELPWLIQFANIHIKSSTVNDALQQLINIYFSFTPGSILQEALINVANIIGRDQIRILHHSVGSILRPLMPLITYAPRAPKIQEMKNIQLATTRLDRYRAAFRFAKPAHVRGWFNAMNAFELFKTQLSDEINHYITDLRFKLKLAFETTKKPKVETIKCETSAQLKATVPIDPSLNFSGDPRLATLLLTLYTPEEQAEIQISIQSQMEMVTNPPPEERKILAALTRVVANASNLLLLVLELNKPTYSIMFVDWPRESTPTLLKGITLKEQTELYEKFIAIAYGIKWGYLKATNPIQIELYDTLKPRFKSIAHLSDYVEWVVKSLDPATGLIKCIGDLCKAAPPELGLKTKLREYTNSEGAFIKFSDSIMESLMEVGYLADQFLTTLDPTTAGSNT